MEFSCRFYSNEFPDIEDTVMVKVHKIGEMGAYVTLSEYNNKEGMILLSELSRRRIRSVNKLVRVGRSECVAVIRVDQDKGYIDLSKRRVYTKDVIQCEDRFAKAKVINSILRHVAEQVGYKTSAELEGLYEKTAWYFDLKFKKKAAAYDIFKKALTDPTVFDECDISEKVKEKLIEDIKKRLTPQALKIRADIEVSCFAYEGIEAIKAALGEGKKCSTEEMPIKINLIAAPLFVITTQTMERVEGIEAVTKALDAIKASIESFGGSLKVIMPPKAVTDFDEDEIKKRLDQEADAEEARGQRGSKLVRLGQGHGQFITWTIHHPRQFITCDNSSPGQFITYDNSSPATIHHP
ncbi:eukaryotic translation initiation factor 2 alpha subunit domain-containing protein [Ditylenchus destructor]|uniref:Eukaryotic translation initiation factor 2 subunit 1 n=1 Tax=Ditylenchus destructor TaxID=166010 RepID=A0AAD4R5I8_9BILA|nr:eukaryotic translation initiation factor 2 alpha subunit domain-containing protein [Ditylenchus destructor]